MWLGRRDSNSFSIAFGRTKRGGETVFEVHTAAVHLVDINLVFLFSLYFLWLSPTYNPSASLSFLHIHNRGQGLKRASLTKTKRLHRAHSSTGCSSSVRTATKPAHSWRRERTPSAAGGDDSAAPLPASPPLPLLEAVAAESAGGIASRPRSASASAKRHSSKKARQMDRSRCACRALEVVPPILARWAAAC